MAAAALAPCAKIWAVRNRSDDGKIPPAALWILPSSSAGTFLCRQRIFGPGGAPRSRANGASGTPWGSSTIPCRLTPGFFESRTARPHGRGAFSRHQPRAGNGTPGFRIAIPFAVRLGVGAPFNRPRAFGYALAPHGLGGKACEAQGPR